MSGTPEECNGLTGSVLNRCIDDTLTNGYYGGKKRKSKKSKKSKKTKSKRRKTRRKRTKRRKH